MKAEIVFVVALLMGALAVPVYQCGSNQDMNIHVTAKKAKWWFFFWSGTENLTLNIPSKKSLHGRLEKTAAPVDDWGEKLENGEWVVYDISAADLEQICKCSSTPTSKRYTATLGWIKGNALEIECEAQGFLGVGKSQCSQINPKTFLRDIKDRLKAIVGEPNYAIIQLDVREFPITEDYSVEIAYGTSVEEFKFRDAEITLKPITDALTEWYWYCEEDLLSKSIVPRVEIWYEDKNGRTYELAGFGVDENGGLGWTHKAREIKRLLEDHIVKGEAGIPKETWLKGKVYIVIGLKDKTERIDVALPGHEEGGIKVIGGNPCEDAAIVPVVSTGVCDENIQFVKITKKGCKLEKVLLWEYKSKNEIPEIPYSTVKSMDGLKAKWREFCEEGSAPVAVTPYYSTKVGWVFAGQTTGAVPAEIYRIEPCAEDEGCDYKIKVDKDALLELYANLMKEGTVDITAKLSYKKDKVVPEISGNLVWNAGIILPAPAVKYLEYFVFNNPEPAKVECELENPDVSREAEVYIFGETYIPNVLWVDTVDFINVDGQKVQFVWDIDTIPEKVEYSVDLNCELVKELLENESSATVKGFIADVRYVGEKKAEKPSLSPEYNPDILPYFRALLYLHSVQSGKESGEGGGMGFYNPLVTIQMT